VFLLDTNALAEMEKPRPDSGFVNWIGAVDWLDLHLSVITVAELWKGIAVLSHGPKRRALEAMFNSLPDRFHGRICEVDFSTAVTFGEIQAAAGPLPSLDTLIAATAITKRLTLVTRNTTDMVRTGAAILDPWST
jgi:predicted nucleic acid-binding protein